MTKLKFLGTGSPEGMPIMICDCKYCDGNIVRSRPSILIEDNRENIIFDISPDIRSQLIQNNVKKINSVLLTHPHFDHVWGIGDLAQLNWVNLNNFDFYLSKNNFDFLKKNFEWIDMNYEIFNYNNGVELGNLKVIPFKVEHSDLFETAGFLIEINNKKIVYIPDLKNISKENKNLCANVDILIIDGQYIFGHYIDDDDHIAANDSINLIEELNPKRTYLIAYSEHWYKLSSKEAVKKLPKNIFIPNDNDEIRL